MFFDLGALVHLRWDVVEFVVWWVCSGGGGGD